MWTERLVLSAVLALVVTPVAASYTHAPFHDRPYAVADLALTVLEQKSPVAVPTDDVPLAAAVAAFLLVSDQGLAEAYEEAVEGEADDDDAGDDVDGDGYARAHALLQVIRPWIATVSSDAEVEDLVARLQALMPTPDRPNQLDADPEAAEVLAQALVGALERAADADLYLARDLGKAMAIVADLVVDACDADADAGAQARRVQVATVYYDDTLAAPLSVMASPEAEQIRTGLAAMQRGDLKACDGVGQAFVQARQRLFP